MYSFSFAISSLNVQTLEEFKNVDHKFHNYEFIVLAVKNSFPDI